MRPSFRPAAVALVVVAALSASGCAPPSPATPPTSSPSSTALFASDEEALAAAEKAYREYLSESDAITSQFGAEPQRIDPFVAPALRKEIHDSFAKYSERRLRTEGVSTFDSVQLQSVSDTGGETTSVDLYVCLDIGSVRVISESGDDVTPESRVDRLPLTLSFSANESADGLRLERSESWSGDDFCG